MPEKLDPHTNNSELTNAKVAFLKKAIDEGVEDAKNGNFSKATIADIIKAGKARLQSDRIKCRKN